MNSNVVTLNNMDCFWPDISFCRQLSQNLVKTMKNKTETPVNPVHGE